MRRHFLVAAAAVALWAGMVVESYGQGEIWTCVKNKGGKIRVVSDPGQCKPGKETAISFLTQANADALQAQVVALETLLAHFTRSDNDIYITGANLHIRSGEGSTDGVVNGLGNLIVGYNESRGDGTDDRTGSHNIVGGWKNNYTSYGGLVVGEWNMISGAVSSVSGGERNTASGNRSSVTAGADNTASANWSSVSGGDSNTASANWSSVSGGNNNTAGANWSSVSGGDARSAAGVHDWAAGALWEDN